jgi:hypothetical protein
MNHTISLSRSGKTITLNRQQIPNEGKLPILLKDTGLITFASDASDNDVIVAEFLQSEQLIEILNEIKWEKESAQIAKQQRNEEMQLIGKSIETSSAIDILRYVSHISKSDCGWQAAEILIGKNALAEMLLNFFGCSFTATPFDNGQIICKSSRGIRLSLKRSQHATIATALNLF